MTGLTDRMRTCAAHILGTENDDGVGPDDRSILDVRTTRDAAALLVEAAHLIDMTPAPLGEPMEVIPPVPTLPEGTVTDTVNAMLGTWTAPGDTLPIAHRLRIDDLRRIPYRSRDACPTCDSRAPKRVRRAGKSLVFVCPVCGLITKKPPAEGTAGGKE